VVVSTVDFSAVATCVELGLRCRGARVFGAVVGASFLMLFFLFRLFAVMASTGVVAGVE
jgi:hypothetical protein